MAADPLKEGEAMTTYETIMAILALLTFVVLLIKTITKK